MTQGAEYSIVSNHSPLRLTGGGEHSFDSVISEHQENLLQNSMSEQDIRDVLFEAGYTIKVIDDILVAKALAGLNDPADSMISVDSDVSGSESTRESTVLSDSIAGNAIDMLKEIRIKNVNNVTIGSLNINSLAPKFEELKEIIGKNLDILTIQETKLDSSFPTHQFSLDGFLIPYRVLLRQNSHLLKWK